MTHEPSYNLTEGQPIADPFGAIARVETDKPGVRIWDHKRVTPGLVIFHTVVGNKIVVIDLDGTVVLEFRELPTGYELYRPAKAGDRRNIYCILVSKANREHRAIAALSDDGSIIWMTKHHHFTHDFHIQHNRRVLSVVREERTLAARSLSDTVLCDMDLTGEISWRWSVLDNLHQLTIADEIRRSIIDRGSTNPFHVNSIQRAEAPKILAQLGEPSVVVSARNMNSVFIVGCQSGRVLFEYSGHTLGQHHARILDDGVPGAGNLILMDNGYSAWFGDEERSRAFSRVLELRLPSGEPAWEYRSNPSQPPFFSPIVGGQQRLPNGNTLITEGYYGRIFEVTADGEIVWDYIYPEANGSDDASVTKTLREAGLRQVYRAYKVDYRWLE
jgi:hypothetical protein